MAPSSGPVATRQDRRGDSTGLDTGRAALMLVNYDNGHFTEDKSVTYRNFANQFAFAKLPV
jgi:hypothetical protein